MTNRRSAATVGTVAAWGMLWAALMVVMSKAASLISQIFLGWILSADDFGLYAIAISTASVISFLKNGGLQKILIQRGSDFNHLARSGVKIALFINLAIMTILIAGAPIVEKLYQFSDLKILLWIIALSIPLNTPVLYFRAKLSLDLKFKEISKIDIYSSLLRYSFTVVFAYLGFGPLSFVLPLIIIAVYEAIAFWYLVRTWPSKGISIKRFLSELWPQMRWVLVGAFVISLGLQGDYLVLGFLTDIQTLGLYFFAFQLSISFSIFFTMALDGVLMPAFARLSIEIAEQLQMFFSALNTFTLIFAPLIVTSVIFAKPVIDTLWAGKWNEAILPTQFLIISLLTRIPMLLSISLMEARGRWKDKTILQMLDVVGIMVSSAIGAMWGSVAAIGLAAGLYRFVSGIIFTLIVAKTCSISLRKVMTAILLPTVIAIFAGMLAMLLTNFATNNLSSFIEATTRCFIFLSVFTILSYFFLFEEWTKILNSLKHLKMTRFNKADLQK